MRHIALCLTWIPEDVLKVGECAPHLPTECLDKRDEDLEYGIRVKRKAFGQEADPTIQNRPTAGGAQPSLDTFEQRRWRGIYARRLLP